MPSKILTKLEFFKITSKSTNDYFCANISCQTCPFHGNKICTNTVNSIFHNAEERASAINKMILDEKEKYENLMEYRPLEILPEDLIA